VASGEGVQDVTERRVSSNVVVESPCIRRPEVKRGREEEAFGLYEEAASTHAEDDPSPAYLRQTESGTLVPPAFVRALLYAPYEGGLHEGHPLGSP
jgi:hypothetical protein